MRSATVNLSYELAAKSFSYNPDTGEILRFTKHGIQKTGHVKRGYIVLRLHGQKYFAHRVAFLLFTGSMPNGFIDHIDGDGLNNRISNLRDVEQVENSRNISLSTLNTSGIMGVSWRTDQGIWRAYIRADSRYVALKSDGTLFGAACARKSAEIHYGYHANHGRKRRDGLLTTHDKGGDRA